MAKSSPPTRTNPRFPKKTEILDAFVADSWTIRLPLPRCLIGIGVFLLLKVLSIHRRQGIAHAAAKALTLKRYTLRHRPQSSSIALLGNHQGDSVHEHTTCTSRRFYALLATHSGGTGRAARDRSLQRQWGRADLPHVRVDRTPRPRLRHAGSAGRGSREARRGLRLVRRAGLGQEERLSAFFGRADEHRLQVQTGQSSHGLP